MPILFRVRFAQIRDLFILGDFRGLRSILMMRLWRNLDDRLELSGGQTHQSISVLPLMLPNAPAKLVEIVTGLLSQFIAGIPDFLNDRIIPHRLHR